MAKKEKSYGEILTAGFIKENPVLRLVLGTCPTLAVTTQAFGMLPFIISLEIVSWEIMKCSVWGVLQR